MSTFALVLAGGSGTRFWPASRARLPKQLLPLAGDRSLISTTVDRVLDRVGGWERVLVASGAAVADATREALPDLPEANLLVEPCPRNTAPCIAWATSVIARRDPDAIIVVLPSDHFVADAEAFQLALDAAIASARAGHIATLGISPTRPETGFGYIEVGEPLAGGDGRARGVVRFVEKPSREVAEAYVASGRFVWNAGMFVFRARDMRAAVAAHLPPVEAALLAFEAAAADGHEQSVVDRLFGALPSVSIDVGVMEKVKDLAVVPVDMGWSDIGSWQAAWELAERDASGNATRGDVVVVEGRGNLVHDLRSARAHTDADARPRTIALLGVDDLVVVETDDALLVCPRDRAQDVRLVVEQLKATKRGALT